MEATKKPSTIFARSRANKNAQYSALEQQVGTAILDIVSHL